MSLSSISSRGSANSIDVLTPSDDYASRADASATRFAAMLANAIEPHKPDVRAPVQPDRSSELDATDEGDETATAPKADAPVAADATITTSATNAASAAAALLGRPATGLDPVLRAKLARVIERMRTEEGKTVAVAEGVRSQGRQNTLYAQGRTTEGPVVTWTRNSLHVNGLAADLTVDGGFTDQGGFAALQRIAEEEGLHTLGKMDPGHVELRGARAGNALDSPGTLASSKDSASQGILARATGDTAPQLNAALRAIATPLAATTQVARVASTAKVATVATVASVATAGAAASTHGARSANTGTGEQRSDSRGGGEQQTTGSGGVEKSIPPEPGVGDRAYSAFSAPGATKGREEVLTISGPDAPQGAARVERVLDIQDARGEKSISRLSLNVEDGRGGVDTVRIGMRGNSVGASFDIRDAGGADRVASRIGELTRALERRGLEPQAFSVRSVGPASHDGAVATTRLVSAQTVGTQNATMRNEDQAGARGESRQAFGQQQEQQERARERSDDRRRRDGIFSLTQEEA